MTRNHARAEERSRQREPQVQRLGHMLGLFREEQEGSESWGRTGRTEGWEMRPRHGQLSRPRWGLGTLV